MTISAPRIASAAMLSTVWETSVPSSTGRVSRIRPTRRASTIARAGSPRRAGSVADISTPIIVAEVTSRRRRGLFGSAARAIAYQEVARRKSDPHISAVATSTQVRSERTMLVTTLSTPIRFAAMKVSTRPSTPARASAARRAVRACPGACGTGSSDGSRFAGTSGEPSTGTRPVRRATASSLLAGSGTGSVSTRS